MTRSQFFILAVLVAAGGIVGGAAVNVFLLPLGAYAAGIEAANVAPAKPDNVVRTRAVELLNDAGKVIARLAPTENDDASLILYDKQGAVTAMFGVAISGNPTLMLQGKGGAKAVVDIDASGAPSLGVQDAKGRTRFRLGLTPDDSPVLIMRDNQMKSGILLKTASHGEPHIAIIGKDGAGRAAWGLAQDDLPYLALNDVKGNTRVVVGHIAPGQAGEALPPQDVASITLFDENRQPTWQAP